ncbi:OSBP(oxysterol binding protein)-related protein 2B [Actinidia rufa]|uniref:OSBP(Oxysterol binding protein)-related protein 2B n=1 Tax=Actinidia rufa TaxID=165716 RepID=A0A7J0FTC8_9ERIC|nr:OSBP(oxysterol binding protein)-related protein 2B [Actinidia rufa]
MRVKEMHPLCCISLESPGIGDRSPDVAASRGGSRGPAEEVSCGSDGNGGRVADLRPTSPEFSTSGRITARDGDRGGSCCVTASSRTPRIFCELFWHLAVPAKSCSLTLPFCVLSRLKVDWVLVKQLILFFKPILCVSSFRESRSDDRRFYIFTATKTLHLRTNSRRDRVAWIEALVSSRNLFYLRPLHESLSLVPNDVSISTDRLKKRLTEGGIGEELVKDCEQIMLSEFSEIQGQFKVLCEERSNLLDTLRQLEAANTEAEGSGIPDSVYQLLKHEVSSIGRGKYSAQQHHLMISRNKSLRRSQMKRDATYFDTEEYFSETTVSCGRKKLPDPIEKEKGVSLWSMIKDNVGKDLTRVCLPVYFNEPISSLQKCFEDLEYSYLLDHAYEHGKAGNSLLRILNVAAFAVSGYGSSEGRHCKPFNPLLGETFEADYPEKGVRFFSEKVSHHPTLIACHCEGKGWKFWGDSNLRTKFWGTSIQLDPVGTLTLEFDDGEVFQWNKVTTTICNLILGKVYLDHHGTMHIRGNRQYSCKLKFKEQSILDRNPHQVHGFVEDVTGKKAATLFGKCRPPNFSRYNMTSFAITLNELTPGLQEKLPPTDSRLRPDQRHLENGEYEKANGEKLRLEKRQRMVCPAP